MEITWWNYKDCAEICSISYQILKYLKNKCNTWLHQQIPDEDQGWLLYSGTGRQKVIKSCLFEGDALLFQEDEGYRDAEDADTAVLQSKTGLPVHKKKEWYIWNKLKDKKLMWKWKQKVKVKVEAKSKKESEKRCFKEWYIWQDRGFQNILISVMWKVDRRITSMTHCITVKSESKKFFQHFAVKGTTWFIYESCEKKKHVLAKIFAPQWNLPPQALLMRPQWTFQDEGLSSWDIASTNKQSNIRTCLMRILTWWCYKV